MSSKLTPFWIVTQNNQHPLGFGVTASSLSEAIKLIRLKGFDICSDLSKIDVREDVKIKDLDQEYVTPHMGSISRQGVWYPKYK